ncbi:MAG TPA: hypothetical protein VJR47_20925 [Stellaceae bacterium]|nr:hypothetical protein [Stellaceae bacterium]
MRRLARLRAPAQQAATESGRGVPALAAVRAPLAIEPSGSQRRDEAVKALGARK